MDMQFGEADIGFFRVANYRCSFSGALAPIVGPPHIRMRVLSLYWRFWGGNCLTT